MQGAGFLILILVFGGDQRPLKRFVEQQYDEDEEMMKLSTRISDVSCTRGLAGSSVCPWRTVTLRTSDTTSVPEDRRSAIPVRFERF